MTIFRSVKFNIGLFLVIALSAAGGTLIPQREPMETYLRSYGPHWASLFHTLGLFDVYHAWWFAGLLGLVGFDVVVCKLWRRPPDQGLSLLPDQGVHLERSTAEAILGKPYRAAGLLPIALAEAARTVRSHLQQRRYVLGEQAPAGGVLVWAARHRLQRWGSYIAHVSLVVILLGGVVKSLLGFETFLPIVEGREALMLQGLLNETETFEQAWHQRPSRTLTDWALHAPAHLQAQLKRRALRRFQGWRVALDRFTVDFYPESTTPSTFASDVRVWEGDRQIVTRTIRVNAPLDLQHVRFYQASWGVTGMLRSVTVEVHGHPRPFAVGESVALADYPWRARVDHLLPDFTVGQAGGPTTQSLEWNHPGVVLSVFDRVDRSVGTLVLGAPAPGHPEQEHDWGMFFYQGRHFPVRPPLKVLGIDPVLFSGIQVGYDPGFPLIVAGVLALLFGLSTLFYLHQRRVWVLLQPRGEATEVTIGGWSSRPGEAFQREFTDLIHAILPPGRAGGGGYEERSRGDTRFASSLHGGLAVSDIPVKLHVTPGATSAPSSTVPGSATEAPAIPPLDPPPQVLPQADERGMSWGSRGRSGWSEAFVAELSFRGGFPSNP